MGHNIAILCEKPAERGLDENHTARLEIEECIHFHQDDFRLVWTTEEFLALSDDFFSAAKKLRDIGAPPTTEHMLQLSGRMFDHKCMHHDRIAAELTKDGTIHMHFKNLRLHMTKMDFYEFADGMREALLSLDKIMSTTVDITSDSVLKPGVCSEYLEMLDKYCAGEFPKEDYTSMAGLRDLKDWYERHPKGDNTTEADLKREDGMLPSPWCGTPPIDVSRRYLFSLYESVKQWGYAGGPFNGDLMPVYKYENGSTYLKGAHRTAVLLKLGYTDVEVALADKPTGWGL